MDGSGSCDDSDDGSEFEKPQILNAMLHQTSLADAPVILTGSIPTLIAGMTTLILTQNQLSGSIPDLPITLSYLELASNNLEGSIPQLPSEMVSLNLANNKLTGTIPPLPIFVQGSGTTVGSAILVGNCFTNPGPFINNCGFNATTTTLRTSPVSGSPSISTITGPLLTVGKASLTPTSIPSSESGPNISAIVGGIIGSIFGIVAIGVFVWWFHRLKQPKVQLEDSSLYLEAAKPSGDYDRRPTVQSQGSSSGGLFSLAGSSYTGISEQTGVSEKTGAGGSVFTTLTAGLERGSAAFLASITPAGREKHLFEGKGGEGNVSPGSGLPGDVSCWSTQNVAYWIYFNHGGEHVARKVMGKATLDFASISKSRRTYTPERRD
ncbi:hypothetical protein BCR33DRAFT_735543 [Rhizoclosmatium globosum]|uniref:L domain-like protein n=1 Tax=Rhizoclosmatium globosum TaxID=329046 RepID=A0A1Y2CNZ0_9FUNG|nr:hypothetical protein BCR33DRAFT_735543 [Rhizoclosmatium globosum]|eukprot:ORY48741.1 hypothetical protein BCR33DRAFT_735543 [Rhizoclosmatium globosum]